MDLPKYCTTVSVCKRILIIWCTRTFFCPSTENDSPGVMLPGMVFTIEPILSLGEQEIEILDDGWTAVTTDQSRTAQFEHTVLVTDSGVDILTE